MKTILFQGDSITDCGRVNTISQLGDGYACFTAAHLALENPGEYTFYNRGISGNRIADLYARIKEDLILLEPDYLSLLIGVNDIWHEYETKKGANPEKFEKIYDMLLEEIKEALPNVKIMIFEPFCLRASATDNTESFPNKWDIFSQEVKNRVEKVRKVAKKHDILCISLQDKFDEAVKKTGNNADWLYDGVHPTVMGHELIKREWLKAFECIK